MSGSGDSIEIVKPFTEAVSRAHDNVQVIGGVGSAALAMPGVEIVPSERLVIAPEGMTLSQRRPNGTLRDLDCLVLTTEQDTIGDVEALAEETIGDQLELSIFGLRNILQLERQRQNPLMSTAKVWVADRYVAESNRRVLAAKKAIFPFAVNMNMASLETWRLQIGDDDSTPIPHPGATILNYLTRSISGLRPKDANKVNELTDNIGSKAPEIIDWVMGAPGQSQIEFARILHTLREPTDSPRSLDVGGVFEIKPYELSDLVDLPAFMLDSSSSRAQEAVVKAARIKSRGLHLMEDQEQLTRLWQMHVEPRIGAILKNEA